MTMKTRPSHNRPLSLVPIAYQSPKSSLFSSKEKRTLLFRKIAKNIRSQHPLIQKFQRVSRNITITFLRTPHYSPLILQKLSS